MAETPTPRTHSHRWIAQLGDSKTAHDSIEGGLALCESIETDLQHLARVAGEALEDALGWLEDSRECEADLSGIRAALSEIQRIKNL